MQLELDMSQRARRSDPETSHEAAARAKDFTSGHYAAIRLALLEHGPMSIYEIGTKTGLTHVQVARRTAEMNGVMIERTSDKRPSPSGRGCHVWRAK